MHIRDHPGPCSLRVSEIEHQIIQGLSAINVQIVWGGVFAWINHVNTFYILYTCACTDLYRGVTRHGIMIFCTLGGWQAARASLQMMQHKRAPCKSIYSRRHEGFVDLCPIASRYNCYTIGDLAARGVQLHLTKLEKPAYKIIALT